MIFYPQIQHITLNEFAPSILGDIAYSDDQLRPTTTGFYSGYSSENRGGAFDSVALAALQVLTSLKRSDNSAIEEQVLMASNKVNLNIAEQGTLPGWDPAALLVHAARDHGLPGYVDFITKCSGGNMKV